MAPYLVLFFVMNFCLYDVCAYLAIHVKHFHKTECVLHFIYTERIFQKVREAA